MTIGDIKKYIEKDFSGLTFDPEPHKYFVNKVPIRTSVSGLIKNYYEPFDTVGQSVTSAYWEGVTPEQKRKEWEDYKNLRIDIGNKAHLFGELYTYNRELRPQSQYDVAIMKFWADLPDFIVPIMVEAQMYHKISLYAGTSDIVLFNLKTNQFIIADYKTNGDIFKNYKGKTMLGAFSHLLDSPYNHYQLQLSYYQILLEQVAGIVVSHRKV